jgi:hypothetical protein
LLILEDLEMHKLKDVLERAVLKLLSTGTSSRKLALELPSIYPTKFIYLQVHFD